MPPAAPMTKSMTPAVWGLMAVLALLWGTSFLSIRFALAGIGPLSIVAVRVTGAAAVIWLVVLLTRRPVPRDPLDVGLRHATSDSDAVAKIFALGTAADLAAVWVGGDEVMGPAEGW